MSESEPISTPAFAVGSVIADRYRVLGKLGEGAMGAVYVVEHTITRHKRAMKTLHASICTTSAVVARFLNEASAAGHIDNAHIVETVDAGRLPDGSPYLVMELLQGQPLDDLLAGRGPLEPVEAAEIVAQACAGIHAAHEKGVVHRDLKPANLFVVKGSLPFVKILDFGISRFEHAGSPGQRLTQTGQLIGTPYYMSPEQALTRSDIDERSDVYALGVVLYECLTGKLPFEGASYLELLTNIVNAHHTPVEKLRPEVPAPLCAVVRQAMASERSQRFASAGGMEQALRSLPLVGMSRVDPALMMPRLSGYPSSRPPDAPPGGTVLAVSVPPTAVPADAAQTDFAATDSPMSRSVQPNAALPSLPQQARRGAKRVVRVAAAVALAGILGLAWYLLRSAASGSATSARLPNSASPSISSPPSAEALVDSTKSESAPPAATGAALPSAPTRAVAHLAPSSRSGAAQRQAEPGSAGSSESAPPSPTAVAPAPAASSADRVKSRAEKAGLQQKNPFAQ